MKMINHFIIKHYFNLNFFKAMKKKKSFIICFGSCLHDNH